ncbi:MAG: hypothetical protein HUJ27_08935 [Rhodobacteraceae bacterium]|nr:hypothetical protein [Paracoccaceae bacterium]
MKRRHILTLIAFVMVFPALAHAQTLEERITAQLREQGYTSITVERTFLGRVRILAEGPGMEREIVLNPRTGEILRDIWELDDGDDFDLFDPRDDDGEDDESEDDSADDDSEDDV